MEKNTWILLLAIIVIHFIATNGQPFFDDRAENQELRTSLRESREQNRRLEHQLSRLKLVWTGLQKMCNVLSQSREDDTGSSLAAVESSKEKLPLRVLSATSSGFETGDATVTVTYTAPPVHATDWFIIYDIYNQRNMVRTSGERTDLSKMKYSSSVVMSSNVPVKDLILNLYAGKETASVSFNVKVIGNMSNQSVSEYKSPVLEADLSYVAPNDGDLDVTFILNGTLHQLPYSDADVFISGLNATEETATVFESVYDLWYSGHQRTNNTSTITVTVNQPYVQTGGILTVRFAQKEFKEDSLYGDLVERIKYGHSITILPADSKELIPMDTVGLYQLQNRTLMVAPRLSLTCMAMGNPLPNVQIFRKLDNGRRKKLPTEYINMDGMMVVGIHTLEASDRKTPGNYICRAESGNAVTEERTEVVVYTPVRFDEARTGVIKNNTKKVVYGCKAKGKGNLPELEFRLYEWGPNLANVDEYKVSNVKIGKTTRKITLTISPPNDLIHTVYCASLLHGVEEYKKLELFPGTYQDRSWDLFDKYASTNFTMPE